MNVQCPVYSSVAPKNWKWPLKSKTQLVMGTDWAAGNPSFGVFYCSQRTDCLDIELTLYWGVHGSVSGLVNAAVGCGHMDWAQNIFIQGYIQKEW